MIIDIIVILPPDYRDSDSDSRAAGGLRPEKEEKTVEINRTQQTNTFSKKKKKTKKRITQK